MSSVNKVILIGHLAADPEIRYTAAGKSVAHFRIATNESWTGKDGNKEERTEWHRIVAWGKLGELCSQYLSKGRQVFIEGSLRTNSWETKEGEKRYSTEVTANNVVFLGGKGTPAGTGAGAEKISDIGEGSPGPGYEAAAPAQGVDEDVPF